MLNGLVLVGLVTSHFLFFLERRKLMKKRVILKTGIEILVTVGVGIILDAAIERVLGTVSRTLRRDKR